MEEGNGVNASRNSVNYKGVRKRKWGKWVSEIREPGKKTRIWLGSFETAEMAAVAHDTAVLYLRGNAGGGVSQHLNFPHVVEYLPLPASSTADDIRLAAQQAAASELLLQLINKVDGHDYEVEPMDINGAGGSSEMMNFSAAAGNVQQGLSPVQIQAIHDLPLDSPDYRMWMEMDRCCGDDHEENYEEIPDDTLWD